MISQEILARKETSDFNNKEALFKAVWRFATTMFGVWCVKMSGITLMLKLLADNWAYLVQV